MPLHGAVISSQINADGELVLSMPTVGPLLAAGLNKSQLMGAPPLRSLNLEDVEDLGDCTLLASSVASHTALTSHEVPLRTHVDVHVFCRSLSDMPS